MDHPINNKILRITWLDAAILAILAGVVVYVSYKGMAGLTYHWKWEVIPQFLLRFDEDTHHGDPACLPRD